MCVQVIGQTYAICYGKHPMGSSGTCNSHARAGSNDNLMYTTSAALRAYFCFAEKLAVPVLCPFHAMPL